MHELSFFLYSRAAILAAYASNPETGFRLRDACFLYGLFTNWANVYGTQTIQAVQYSRILTSYSTQGIASQRRKKSIPYWRLTHVGIVELVRDLVGSTYLHQPDDFFFLYTYLKSYKVKLKTLAEQSTSMFPPALNHELDYLLKEELLLKREVCEVKKRVVLLQHRVQDARNATKTSRKLAKEGASTDEIVAYIQTAHPYELNSEKPLNELISELPGDIKMWELIEGTTIREKYLFGQRLQRLESYLLQLEKLLKEYTCID